MVLPHVELEHVIECDECDGSGATLYEVGVPDYDHGCYIEDRLLTCQKCLGEGTEIICNDGD